MPKSRSLIICGKKVGIFTSKILPLNQQTVRELHLNLNSKGSHIPAGVFFSVAVIRVFPFMVQLGFTRAATGYWHRQTLPRRKFEKDPGHKKFVVSLVIALKTVIAALQTNRSSWPFSAPVIVIRKRVSLVPRNKFVDRDTATNGDGIFWYRFPTLLIIGNVMLWSVQRLVHWVPEAFHARFPFFG